MAIVLAAIGLVGAPGVAHAAQAAKATKVTGAITVSAAASLTEAFTKMGADFQKRNPGTTVTFNFGSSATLAQQIQGGAPADVFASADGANMQKLVSGGVVSAEPTAFASNLLTVVVKPRNPQKVKSITELADLDVVSLCGASVPCGKYADQVLSGAGVTIDSAKVTRGADVKTTLAAVATGDADAAIVYVTDAKSAGGGVTAVPIPAWQNAYAIYPVAPIAASTNQDLAEAWVKYTVSPGGQRTLQSFGFLPPPPTG
ncbi:MAG TPA: molybdate ABC transporter substrate-binding protein [Acidimicrobiia bacterium]|nr:molybdate ABC transporter substrate-binding protein [Acidimicrobiia bacterium]